MPKNDTPPTSGPDLKPAPADAAPDVSEATASLEEMTEEEILGKDRVLDLKRQLDDPYVSDEAKVEIRKTMNDMLLRLDELAALIAKATPAPEQVSEEEG